MSKLHLTSDLRDAHHTVKEVQDSNGGSFQHASKTVAKKLGLNSLNAGYDQTRVGSLTKHGLMNGVPKTNQDYGIVCWPFNGKSSEALLAVFDGHGELGHEVSKFCAEQLPALLIANAEKLAEDPEAILRGAVMELDNILFEDEQMRETAKFSGSTATLVYARGDELWVAWVGDSRCIVGHRMHGDVGVALETLPHKADVHEERERIQSRGGKVDVSEDPVRVWYGGYGLAMSRSIGDGHFKRAGVICEPDVEHLHLSPAKRGGDGEICLVLASDGIWDVLSSLEVCTAANDYSSALSACDALVTKAQQRWAREEETYRDDTTAIVVYLPFLPNPKNIKRGQSVSPAAPSTVARTETVPRKMMLPPEPVQAAMRPRPRKREDALVRKAGWCRCMPWS